MSVLLFQECVQGIQLLVPEPLVARGPPGDLTEWRGPQLEVVLAAGPAPPHEACALEDLQVLGDGVQRNRKPRRYVCDPGGPPGESADDGPPGRVGERGEGAVQGGGTHDRLIFNQMVDYIKASPVMCESRAPPLSSVRSEEHTSELQSLAYLVCRLL